MATRVDYANAIDATDIGTIYLTGAGYVNYPFKGASRESALGWEEPVWGAELNRSIDLVMDNIGDVEYGLVARCEISYRYLNVQDYRVLCKIAKQKVCIANFFNRETGERVTQEMAFTGNEIGKLYKFGTDYLGVIDMAIKLVATNRDRQDIIGAEHTITYNANGGTGTILQQTAKWAGQKTLADSGFTKAGVELSEWNSKSNGEGERYLLGQPVTLFGDLTLYAIWTNPVTLKTGASINNLIKETEQEFFLDNTIESIIMGTYTIGNEFYVDGVNQIKDTHRIGFADDNEKVDILKSNDNKKVFILAHRGYTMQANADSSNLFRGLTKLNSIKFNNFYTNNITNMSSMFAGDSNLTELDLSSFYKGDSVDLTETFYNCSNLQTIYVNSEKWITPTVITPYTFYNCFAIVGQNGTTYNSNTNDSLYARVDLPDSRGYLTEA